MSENKPSHPVGSVFMNLVIKWSNTMYEKHACTSTDPHHKYRAAFLFDLMNRLRLEYPNEIQAELDWHRGAEPHTDILSRPEIIVDMDHYKISWDYDTKSWLRKEKDGENKERVSS